MGEVVDSNGAVLISAAKAAELIEVSTRTLSDLRRRGIHERGVHYFYPRGTKLVRYDRAALLAWAREDEPPQRTRLSGSPMNLAMGE